MRYLLCLLLALSLAACDEDTNKPRPSPPEIVEPTNPLAWEIGPIINGKNYSVNMPLHPESHPDGWSIEFPQPNREAGHVHYVTNRHGSMAGKSKIVLRYRIEMDEGVRIVPQDKPELVGAISLYFQRREDWLSDTGRWYAGFGQHRITAPGDYELVASINDDWGSVNHTTAYKSPSAFRTAWDGANRVGFVLGGGDGLGHGVFATGKARIVVTYFGVE